MTKKIKIIIAAIAVVAAAAAFFAVRGCEEGKRLKKAPQEILSGEITRGTIERRVLFTGNIEAKDAVQVFPRATGKVSKKSLREGDAVKRSQAILFVNRDEIGYRFKEMPVDSPIDGFVGKITVDVGSYVSPSGPVALVVRPGEMRVKIDVPERYLDAIAPGGDVVMEVDALGDKTFRGQIISLSPVVDEKTRTARVEISVPNETGGLRHGMFGRLNLVVEGHKDALIAPYESISWEGDRKFIYKIVDGKLSRVEVNVGIRNEEHVEILDGLSEGDIVAVGNLIDLKDGELVK